jgi:hypothetical protein
MKKIAKGTWMKTRGQREGLTQNHRLTSVTAAGVGDGRNWKIKAIKSTK